MRHKYTTSGIVLARTPIGEASALITIVTPDLGLLRARAQGVRKPGAKMASALQTLSESDVIFIRGKDGWRLAGAIALHDWFAELSTDIRERAGRIAGLMLRLVHGDAAEVPLHALYAKFLADTLTLTDSTEADAAECLVALRLLQLLGVDAGDIPGGLEGGYDAGYLAPIIENRSEYIARINHGIAISGL